MRKVIILIITSILIILGIFLFFIYQKTPPGLRTAKINGAEIFIEIADSPQTRAKGLSGRTNLPKDQGMLFIFQAPGRYSFWMKEMLIPLDFLWINGDAIVQIDENIRPRDYQPPKTLTPRQDINKVLELNAGTVERLNIMVGNKIEF